MRVFKFGGASIETSQRVKNVVQIIRQHTDQPLLVVISAKGKTTNALEAVVKACIAQESNQAQQLLDEIIKDHISFTQELINDSKHGIYDKLEELFTEIKWVLSEPAGRAADYYYDQIVSIGELLSTAIIQAFCVQEGLSCEWIDVRDILKQTTTIGMQGSFGKKRS
ncbi:MAG TPA: aspartate kinase, partial [Chitinophagaceae bacterium]|nr:aspartate kinase [Chitinophagaceae bacterium]